MTNNALEVTTSSSGKKEKEKYCNPKYIMMVHNASLVNKHLRLSAKPKAIMEEQHQGMDGPVDVIIHCCASQKAVVDLQSLQQMHLSEYPSNARASWVLIN